MYDTLLSHSRIVKHPVNWFYSRNSFLLFSADSTFHTRWQTHTCRWPGYFLNFIFNMMVKVNSFFTCFHLFTCSIRPIASCCGARIPWGSCTCCTQVSPCTARLWSRVLAGSYRFYPEWVSRKDRKWWKQLCKFPIKIYIRVYRYMLVYRPCLH